MIYNPAVAGGDGLEIANLVVQKVSGRQGPTLTFVDVNGVAHTQITNGDFQIFVGSMINIAGGSGVSNVTGAEKIGNGCWKATEKNIIVQV